MSDASGEPKPSKLRLSSSKPKREATPDAPSPQPETSPITPRKVTLAKKSAPTPQEATPTTPTGASVPTPKPSLRMASTTPTPAAEPTPTEASAPALKPSLKMASTTPAPAAEPTPTPQPAGKTSATPPPLTKKTPLQVNQPTQKKSNEPARPIPSPPPKDGPLGSLLIILALFAIVSAAGAGIWLILKSDSSETTDVVEPTAETTTAPLKPSPSNPIERAKATIAEVPHRTLDGIIDPPSTAAENTTPVAEKVTPPPTAPTTPAPKASTPPPTPVANSLKDEVSNYLQYVHIGGVRTGTRARIMLNGENYNINDIVDVSTGLTFIGTREGKLLFKDRNGVTYVKSF